MADRVIIDVGPKGRIKNVRFEGSAAGILTGGRLTGWLPRLMLEAKKVRHARKIERRYDAKVDMSEEAKKSSKPRAKAIKKKAPAQSDKKQ